MSPCDTEPSLALGAVVTLASQMLWEPVSAPKCPGPSVGSPELAMTSKTVWLSSVTPTDKGSLLAFVSQKHRREGWPRLWNGTQARILLQETGLTLGGWLQQSQLMKRQRKGHGCLPKGVCFSLPCFQPSLAHSP